MKGSRHPPAPVRWHRCLPLLAAMAMVHAHAADPVPAWLDALNAIRMLPDPFDARQIDTVAYAPRFGTRSRPPRCVQAATVRPGQYSCWAESGRAGQILEATLDYSSATQRGPASEGRLDMAVAPAPCTTVAQAERAIEHALVPLPAAAYGVRLFGHGMQPLMLTVRTDANGCIVAAALVR